MERYLDIEAKKIKTVSNVQMDNVCCNIINTNTQKSLNQDDHSRQQYWQSKELSHEGD